MDRQDRRGDDDFGKGPGLSTPPEESGEQDLLDSSNSAAIHGYVFEQSRARPEGRADDPDGQQPQGPPGGSLPDESRAPAEDHREQGVRSWIDEAMSPAGRDASSRAPSGTTEEAMSATSTHLSEAAAGALEHKSNRVLPKAFHELMGKERPALLEIGCPPNSMLTRVFQEKASDPEAASRCCVWHGSALSDMRTSHGLQLAVEQIRGLNPRHVWVTVSGSAYSPMQRANQRNTQQVRELKEKREEAVAMYHAAREIMRVCVHLGVHCTLEMSENSEAWRLPVFQELQHEWDLYVANVKGCSVGLQGSQGKLLMKGWRLVTTHQRLALSMHKPCKCPTTYVHEKGNGASGKGSIQHTPEFGRLVYQALQEEFSFLGVVKECRGESVLPESFGKGEICACGDAYLQKHMLQCGNCLLGKDAIPYYESQEAPGTGTPQPSTQDLGDGLPNTAFLAQSTTPGSEPSEAKAQAMSLQASISYKDLEAYLEAHPQQGRTSDRTMMDRTQGTYHTHGSYAFGNHYGMTRRTMDNPAFVKMINRFIAQHFPKDYQWSAFTLNNNVAAPLHKDLNNLDSHPNCSVGLGKYTGGELWAERGF